MGMTMAEKIIAAAAGKESCKAGDIETVTLRKTYTNCSSSIRVPQKQLTFILFLSDMTKVTHQLGSEPRNPDTV